MSHKQAIVSLTITVVIVALFIASSIYLGLREFWAGFLFFTCWGLVEQAKVERLPHAVLGSLVGLGAASLIACLPPLMGTFPGLAVAFGAIVALIYLLMVGWLPLAVNASTFIFITVVTIPEVMQSGRTAEEFVGLTAGVVFFGGLRLLVVLFTKWRTPSEAAGPSA